MIGDELYEFRNALYIGNYHLAIAEGSNAKSSSKNPEDVQHFNAERDSIVLRAQAGLGQHDAVMRELASAAHPVLVATKHWAVFQQQFNHPNSASSIDAAATSAPLQALKELMAENPIAPANAAAHVMGLSCWVTAELTEGLKATAAAAHALEEMMQSKPQATKYVIELRAIIADTLLRMHRVDMAEKEVRNMAKIDDESTLTVLYQGIIALKQGVTRPDKYAEALTHFQDVTGRCNGSSVLVLNLQALANIGKGDLAAAERNLLDALSKKSGDPDTIANLVAVSSLRDKPSENVLRYVNQARTGAPTAVWTRSYVSMEDRFKDACAALGTD